MISKSLQEMIKGRWREFKREPSAMYFVVLMPTVWMIILGLAFSNPRNAHYQLALVAPEPPTELLAERQQIENLFAGHPELSLKQGSRAETDLWLRRGEVAMAIDLASGHGLTYRFDPTNPDGLQAKRAADELIQRGLGRRDAIITAEEPVKAHGSRYIDFLIPGLLALSMLTTSLYGTGMTIVAHRRENLLKRYRATPMNPYEYIASHIIGRYMILGVELLTVMAAGMLLFDFRILGSWPAYLLVCLVSTAAFTSIAILCGARLANTATYNGLNNLVTLPMMMVAGIWFSRHHFPTWLGQITSYLPLTASVDALRKVALEGSGLRDLGFELGLLSVYALVATIAAKKIFKWY